MKKDPDLYLRHILEAIEAIKMFTEGGKRVFLKDRKTRDAVIRNLEVIGEAVKQLPVDFKKKHQGVEWKKIAGMRDKMIHEYFGVDIEIVWNVVDRELPVLHKKIESLLSI